jgi:ribosomal protein S18 acetylase RimI-like enzyme
MVEPRHAVSDDAEELVRLRAIMLTAVDGHSPRPGPWIEQATATFRTRIPDPNDSLVGFVIDKPRPHSGLAACVIGVIDHRLPSPDNPTGRAGHVFNVATDVDYRRRGYSRACMTALLRWYQQHHVTKVDLFATEQGLPVYLSLGFQSPTCPALRLSLA